VGIGGSEFVQDSAFRQREARKEQQKEIEEQDAMTVKRSGFERAAMASAKERAKVRSMGRVGH
jgi:hypothetical protein